MPTDQPNTSFTKPQTTDRPPCPCEQLSLCIWPICKSNYTEACLSPNHRAETTDSRLAKLDRAIAASLMHVSCSDPIAEALRRARMEERERCLRIVHHLNGGHDLREIEEAIRAD